MNRVVVVGGGVVGLCLAWEFQHRGCEVVVLDDREVVSGASAVNAGWLVPAMTSPIPAPGVMAQSLRWLMRPDAPLSVTVQPNVEFLRWAVGFARSCSPRQFANGSAIMAQISERALPAFDRIASLGVAVEQFRDGVLYAFGSEAALHEDLEFFNTHKPGGYSSVTPLRGDALREVEPGLTARNIAGFLLENERSVRPEAFLAAVGAALAAGTTPVLRGKRVTSLLPEGDAIGGVQWGNRRIAADTVVVANGTGMRSLLRTVGVRAPIESGKGYSVTWNVNSQPIVRRPVYLHEDRVAITPFGNGLRAAGMMHVGQRHERVSARHVQAIAAAARASLTEWPATDAECEVGAGLRPISPDGLPVIGGVQGFRNLFVAGGHGMLGVTLAPVTALEVADLVESGRPGDAIAPLALSRFG